VPSFDVIELLPERAQERLRKLRQRSSDAHALCVPYADVQELSAERVQAEHAHKRLIDHPQDDGSNRPETDRRVVAAKNISTSCPTTFEGSTTAEKSGRRRFKRHRKRRLPERTGCATGCPATSTLHDYDGPESKQNKAETVLDAIERVRRRGRELTLP
jgi:hypothetical protein